MSTRLVIALVNIAKKPGWHESGAFVLPGPTIGSDNVRYQASGKGQNLFSLRGDMAGWKTEVAAKCEGNPVLTLAIGCALAGPLLSLVGVLCEIALHLTT